MTEAGLRLPDAPWTFLWLLVTTMHTSRFVRCLQNILRWHLVTLTRCHLRLFRRHLTKPGHKMFRRYLTHLGALFLMTKQRCQVFPQVFVLSLKKSTSLLYLSYLSIQVFFGQGMDIAGINDYKYLDNCIKTWCITCSATQDFTQNTSVNTKLFSRSSYTCRNLCQI